MTSDQITGILRALLPGILGYAAGKGWIGSDEVASLTAAIITLASAGWSAYSNSKTRQIAVVAALPEVKKVVTDNATANTGPLASVPNVVSQ